MKYGPKEPNTVARDAWTSGAPVSPPLMSTPVQRVIMAVAVQISRVSMNTESIWTRPCFTGWDTSAAAAALGAEPMPASLE